MSSVLSPGDWLTLARRRVWRGLTTWPKARGWAETALIAAPTFAAMAAVGFAGGLYHPTSQLAGLPGRLAAAFVAPALGEELVFRGLLTPDRIETPRPWRAIAAVTALFVLWHVFEALALLPKARPIFLRPDFLACAAILGVGCGVARWRTSSLWPAVAIHWLAVVVWQTRLGGPGLEALR